MKVKELFEANDIWAQILGGLAGKSAQQVAGEQEARRQYKAMRDAEKQAKQDAKADMSQPKIDPEKQDTKPTDISDPNKPEGNVNASLDSKVSYAKSKGWVGQRPTNQEKNYLDSVDVYVDPNKLADIPANQNFIPHRPPHEKLSMGSFKAPTADINTALGMKGQEQISGYSSYILTPAGWYSKNREAYINPNSKAHDIIDMYWEKSQGGRK